LIAFALQPAEQGGSVKHDGVCDVGRVGESRTLGWWFRPGVDRDIGMYHGNLRTKYKEDQSQ